jgi:lipopolysaccharide export system permease protein
MWQEALGLLYPLAIVFALIMTKLAFVKQNTMGAFYAFGYDKKRLLAPMMLIAFVTYIIFLLLHTTSFSYAKDKASLLLKNQLNAYNVNDLFFKYNDTFVYMKKLDPIHKRLDEITIFKVKGHEVRYTIHASYALFDGEKWDAKDAVIKRHIYSPKGDLLRYTVEHKKSIQTLEGYKPKIIESLYEGRSLNILDAYHTWRLLNKQHIDSEKIRASLYEKMIVPLFAPAMLLILFFKLPFHARMMSLGSVIALSLGVTFISWGLLFGLNQIGANGVVSPEFTAILPIIMLWIYAVYVYITDERRIS